MWDSVIHQVYGIIFGKTSIQKKESANIYSCNDDLNNKWLYKEDDEYLLIQSFT